MGKTRKLRVTIASLTGTDAERRAAQSKALDEVRGLPFIACVSVESESEPSDLLEVQIVITAPKLERHATYRKVLDTLHKHVSFAIRQ
jgi:hypothetical protein